MNIMTQTVAKVALVFWLAWLAGCERQGDLHGGDRATPAGQGTTAMNQPQSDSPIQPLELTEEQWRQRLTEQQYHILREKGTEPAFSGQYVDTKTPGVYLCAGCGLPLFDSQAKFDSGSGWPSFFQPIDKQHIREQPDHSGGRTRTEILCARCGGHLGHVFNDGPQPTGLRYCVNSASLTLKPNP